MTSNNWKSQLTAEKKISDLIRVCLKFRKNKFNSMVLWSIFFLILVICIVINLSENSNKVNQLADVIKGLVPHVLTYSIGILGFLVAGFAILASSNTNGLFEILSKTKHPREDVNVFQFTFFNFIFVIVVHLTLLSLGFAVFIFTGILNIIDSANYVEVSDCIRMLVNSFVLISLVLSLSFALLSVKSFVWNLYANLVLGTLAESANRNSRP